LEHGAAKTNLLLRAAYWYTRVGGNALDKKRRDAISTAPSRAVVLHARFGSADGWKDVTDTVRRRFQKSRVEMKECKLTPVELGQDRGTDKGKALVIVYRLLGYVWADYYLPVADKDKAGAGSDVFSFIAGYPSYYPQPGIPKPGQDLLVLHGAIPDGRGGARCEEQAQSHVSGATLKMRVSDVPHFSPPPDKTIKPFFFVVYHDGEKVRVHLNPVDQPVVIEPQAGRP
jgi:hypothetical protein